MLEKYYISIIEYIFKFCFQHNGFLILNTPHHNHVTIIKVLELEKREKKRNSKKKK